MSLDVADQPGVLATIAGVFGNHEVSIQSMQQKGQGDERPPDLRDAPRRARPRSTATIHEVRELDAVERIGSDPCCGCVGGEE